MDEHHLSLKRALTPAGSIAIVVGTVIGTGIFLKTALMTQLLGSAGWVLGAWVAAGVLSLAGSLTYAELGAMLPHAGGPYVYLREAYGKLPAFLFGWKELLFTKGASNAAVSIAVVVFLTKLIPYQVVWAQHTVHFLGESVNWQIGTQQVEAIALIVILSAINIYGVAAGGLTQTLLTAAKLVGIVILIVGAFAASHGSWTNLTAAGATPGAPGFSAFGAAMIAALWAYSGWGDLGIAAGEVAKPGRNVPLGLIGGVLIVMALYVTANVAYFYALPLHAVATSFSTAYPTAPPVAQRVAETFVGGGVALLSILFAVSALGTLNGGILTGTRIPYAMARDRQLPRALADVNPVTRTPVHSIVLLAAWASVVTLTGTFDQLTTLIIFVDISLDFFGAASIFILRKKLPQAERPYRTPWYPVVPIAYMATILWLVGNTVATNPLEVLGGVVLVALGLPVYLWQARRAAAAQDVAIDL